MGEEAAQWVELMRGGDADSRRQGREALIALGAEAVPVLIDACYDDDGWIRWEAVNALGSIAFDQPSEVVQAIPALANRALHDSNSHPRWRSLWALGSFSEEVIVEMVLPALREGLGADVTVRWNAAVALAFFGQSDVAPALNETVASEDPFQAWEAVYCLGMVNDDDSVRILAAILVKPEGHSVRLVQESVMTLGRIGDPAAIPALRTALTNPEAGVRWRAAQALEQLEDLESIPAIKAALDCEEDEFAQERMREIIERLEES